MTIPRRALFVLAAALTAAPVFAGDMRSTEEVLTHHLTAFGAGDLEAIMSDYTEDSIMIIPNAVLEGSANIEPLFVALLEEFSKPGMSFEMGATHINDDIAYITWSAETADNIYNMGSDTFVVRDGKIAVQTIALSVTEKE